MSRVLFVVVAHAHPSSLADLVANVRRYCPESELVLYNSGSDPDLGANLGIECVPDPRAHLYAQVTPLFFHIFEWVTGAGRRYDHLVNLETDLLFIRQGYEAFLGNAMRDAEYMTPNLVRNIARTSRWRPYRSLKPELAEWRRFFGYDYVHGGFSPAQVFSRRFIEVLVGHPQYPELLNLVARNRSFTLQEVLFPTIPEFLELRGRSYPDSLRPINRYRPYQGVPGVKRALGIPEAYFVHPVRREPENPARQFILSLNEGREV